MHPCCCKTQSMNYMSISYSGKDVITLADRNLLRKPCPGQLVMSLACVMCSFDASYTECVVSFPQWYMTCTMGAQLQATSFKHCGSALEPGFDSDNLAFSVPNSKICIYPIYISQSSDSARY